MSDNSKGKWNCPYQVYVQNYSKERMQKYVQKENYRIIDESTSSVRYLIIVANLSR